ncbi:MAG: hypothetical protein ACO3GP_03215 [Candidatus Limnocylindrus sp.]
MPYAATSTQRVLAMRERRKLLGLRRLELYAHPSDFEPIKAFAEKLTKRKERAKCAHSKHSKSISSKGNQND